MKSEKLLFAIGNISDDIIENAIKQKKKSRSFKWISVAACFLVLVTAVAVLLFPKENSALPKLEITGEFGAMGFEGYMAYDISELVNANPWTEKTIIKTLPVYKNLYTYDENYEIPQNNEIYMKKLVREIENRAGDMRNVTVKEFSPDSVDIEFEPAVSLPKEYNFDFYSTTEEMKEVADYFKSEYEKIIDMSKPIINIHGGDYDIYNRRLLYLSFYESKGDITEQIINYNFNSVEFQCDDEKRLCRIRVMKTDLSAKAGDYPIISLRDAKKLLKEKKYITTVPYELKGNEKIEKSELIYLTRPTERFYMPYYKFYIQVESLAQNKIKTYGAYYVPAIEEEYISNMPLWDGSFN